MMFSRTLPSEESYLLVEYIYIDARSLIFHLVFLHNSCLLRMISFFKLYAYYSLFAFSTVQLSHASMVCRDLKVFAFSLPVDADEWIC